MCHLVERHRKEKINAGIKRIGDLLPCSQALKQSKNMILGEAFRYISELKQQNDEMLLNGGDKVQAEEIKRLRQQVEDLRKETAHYIELLTANGINFLDDPTIHWKGKQRCAKVAKITPTHLMSKGIIVYSNENWASSGTKMPAPLNPASHSDKQPVNSIGNQPSCSVQIGPGQPLGVANETQINEVTVSSSTSSHIPLATLIPAVSKPCLAVVEQYAAVAPVAPKLPLPGNFVTLQGICPKVAVTAPSAQQNQPAKPTSSLASSTSTMSVQLQPVINLTSLPQTRVSSTLVSNASSVLSQETDCMTLSQTLSGNSAHLRTSAASSTQTTWTTLQLTGNTVQPVCRQATEASNSGQNISQLSVCPVVANPQVHPIPLQVPVQLQTTKPTCIPVRPNPSQLLPAVLSSPQTPVVTQTSLLSQTPMLLHQSPLVPQTGLLTQSQTVLGQPAILPKPAPQSTQSHTYPAIQPLPHISHTMPSQHELQPTLPSQPQAQPALIPQPQSTIMPSVQQTLVPHTQTTTLPVLQAMQVVQMNSDGTPVIGTSLPQNNSNVVILQQANTCPAPQVIREDANNQAACQHIVIIQTPTIPPTQQNHQTNIMPPVVSTLANQITTSSNPCPATTQTKQLVHILPRPAGQVQTQTPQTITVNGQVYVLQSVKSAEIGSSQVSQSATQIIQPTCEEPNTNVTLNCLGALTSLSQSISQVENQSILQVSNQSNVQLQITPSSDTTVLSSTSKLVSGVSTSTESVLPSAIPASTSVSCTVTISPKKTGVAAVNQPKLGPVKRARPVKRKEPTQKRNMCRIAAKPTTSISSQSGLSSTITDINLNSANKEVSHKSTTVSTSSMVISVTSTCSTSTSVCVSTSNKLNHSTAKLAANTTSATSLMPNEEAVDSTLPSYSKTVNTLNSVTPLEDRSALYASCKPVAANDINLKQNKSTESAVPSQCSTLNRAITSTKSAINDDALSNAHISQDKSTGNCTTSCIETESSHNLTRNRTTLTSVSSSENASKVSAVENSLCQPKNIAADTGTDSTKIMETGSLLGKVQQSQTESAVLKAADTIQMPIPFALQSTSSACSNLSDTTPPLLHQESRNINTYNKHLKHSEVNMSISTPSQNNSVNFKLIQSSSSKELGRSEHSSATTENISEAASFLQKDTALSREVSTMGSDPYDSSLVANRQTDSPTAGASNNKGFSVASLLPAGHSITASPNTFGSFSFTSEQAEILAMAARAIFDQDSPGRKNDPCSGENPSTGWELSKTQQTPIIKDRATGQQLKQTNQGDITVSKTPSLVEMSSISASGVRLPQNAAYSQSQASTLTSLNVNNLIRPSSAQSYPVSPNLGQQVSVPSPGGAAILVSQTSSQVTQSGSGPAQVNEYTPLKSALMRTHIGSVMSEHHQKDMPKRSAQDDLVLPINKRSKPCPSSSIARIDVKGTEQIQVMSGQMPPNSSSVMTGNHSDGGSALFSGNTFMTTVLRPSEGHCPPQLTPHEQNQPSVLHLQQGRIQHGTPQSGQILGGSHYLKHQHHQEQQRHLYQLQHHLTQPDTQLHNIQQRTLLQDQNAHKKRVVRGDLACTTSRQERHRLSSYSAEALIGKTSAGGDQRMGLHTLQTARGNSQDQSELQGYVDSSHDKGNLSHNSQGRLSQEQSGAPDIQRISERLHFKTLGSGPHVNNFEVQVSRSGDLTSKSVTPAQRGTRPQTGFRMGAGSSADGRSRSTYGTHPSAQGIQTGAGLPREQDPCHQTFMQSLLGPHPPEQTGHQRAAQGCLPVSIEYNCMPGVSSGELQAKVSSPNLHPTQTAMHHGDNNKGHISQVSGNLHGRSVIPHPSSTPHSSSDTGHVQGSSRSMSAVSQRAHPIGPDPQSSKIRPGDRPRSGNLRPVNTFEPEGPLPLPSGGGVLLGRPQTGAESRRRSIVRFMPDGAQVGGDGNLVSDQHLTQNFGFSFIGEGGMNPPPPINANTSFIPQVTQPNASRTPALLPVEPQNTLPSFYPSYSPAAHPSIPNDIPIQYFPNQMFTSPSADKNSTTPLNNRFGSILSPPRPVGFAQPSYPLLTDMTPMPITNSSSITPHLSNFNLTSLFPEIASAMPPDGSSMPMSPLLSLANTSSSDSNKQSNRPAHNISHILGHDGTSAV
ncbi:Basic helix-loop-helix domain-containing protein USF3 [Bagarius yarrelli]|uniref:Basic helix-loop-helix domain-containing protein USF3 n=1 Tax=Bagarius yarrelli TaxID=175774 RepID=A0A556TWJ6_BAGYA|nr:Basic helix-loop-helix domain-containing protein USF3 [Bagarius yarrelli]